MLAAVVTSAHMPSMLPGAFIVFPSLAAAASGHLAPHASRPVPPPGFVHHGAALATQAITLCAGLAPANAAGLGATLRSISDPASSE
jgi:hypothetical protein